MLRLTTLTIEGCVVRMEVRPQPRCRLVGPHINHSLARIRQPTPPAPAQFSQLLFGSPNRPQEPPQSQPLDAYSSGQPKMWPDSCAKTRSMLSGPQPSLAYSMMIRGPPMEAYAKWSTG